MSIHPKPLEVIESQLALYAGEQHLPNYGARADTLLGELANASPWDSVPDLITHKDRPFRTEHRYNADGTVTTEPLFDKSEYHDLLKQAGSRETIAHLSQMLRVYKDIQPQIDTMLSGQKLGPDNPSFVGLGRDNIAFSLTLNIEDLEKEVIIIMPKTRADYSDKARLNERAIALAKVKGLHGFEQGIAVSYEPAILVVEKAPGKPVKRLSYDEWQAIPASHKEALLADVKALDGKDVSLDANPDNYFYDPIYGFTIIDLGKNAWPQSAEQTTRTNLGVIGEVCGYY